MKVLGHSQIGLTTWAVVVDSTESAKPPNCDNGGAPGRIRTCGLGIRSGMGIAISGRMSFASCGFSYFDWLHLLGSSALRTTNGSTSDHGCSLPHLVAW